MKIAGIDENGLGPVLGPLVVTGIGLRVGDYEPGVMKGVFSDFFPCEDSKKVASWKRMEGAEYTALTLFYLLHGFVPENFGGFMEPVRIGSPYGPKGVACPPAAGSLCFREMALPLFTRLDFREFSFRIMEAGEGLMQRLKDEGLSISSLLTTLYCPLEFNRMVDGMTKNLIDFTLFATIMDRILLSRGDGERVKFLCGKIGGFRRYRPSLALFRIMEYGGVSTALETAHESTYIERDGTVVSFIRDADSLHPPVSLASIVGKFVREGCMESLHRFMEGECSDYRRVSGYRDEKTGSVVAGLIPWLEERGIPVDCVIRKK